MENSLAFFVTFALGVIAGAGGVVYIVIVQRISEARRGGRMPS